MRKVPGDSPAATISRFLDSTGSAEAEIRTALQLGLQQQGWLFSRGTHRQVDTAVRELRQATEAMDLSQMPEALRPMTGVSTALMLRSLLVYDLQQHPDLILPDRSHVERSQLRSWTLPDSTITLEAITTDASQRRAPCHQCSTGDFLFSSATITQVPQDFANLFGPAPLKSPQFGADLYTFWSLLPGGALPPKLFFALPISLRDRLVQPYGGQSLLQWLLLAAATALALLALAAWLRWVRRWHKQLESSRRRLRHGIGVVAIVPSLLLLDLWQWFAVDWINLFGPRQEAVLVMANLLGSLLQALLIYLLAEAIGQLVCYRPKGTHRPGTIQQPLERRKGAGQILTLFRVVGLLGATVVTIQTGRDLGMRFMTLLAMSSVPALVISLGTQQLIRDIFDGFSILLDGELQPGDRCTIGTGKSGDIEGQIRSLGMRSIRLELSDGSMLSIPNSQLAASVVTNHRFRAAVPLNIVLPISTDDPERVQQQLEAARDVLVRFASLNKARAEIEVADQSWQLRVRGEWSAELERESLNAKREQLLLQLMALGANSK